MTPWRQKKIQETLDDEFGVARWGKFGFAADGGGTSRERTGELPPIRVPSKGSNYFKRQTGGRMPVTDRIKANSKVKVPNGTHKSTIVDVWLFNVKPEMRVSERTGNEYQARPYTAEDSNEQEVEFKIQINGKKIDGQPVILGYRVRGYFSPKANFTKIVCPIFDVDHAELRSILRPSGKRGPMTADECKEASSLLREACNGQEGLVTTEYKEPYTNVKGFVPEITPTWDEENPTGSKGAPAYEADLANESVPF